MPVKLLEECTDAAKRTTFYNPTSQDYLREACCNFISECLFVRTLVHYFHTDVLSTTRVDTTQVNDVGRLIRISIGALL